ncbi:MAG: hypothetical protein EON93_05690 [Burkholderiales bacterium]|nr:MAG: hypothetical protein EON93_05690 [Burkholderiales bacterium]
MRSDPGQMDLRRRWTLFADTAAAAFRREGWDADQVIIDRWAIGPASVGAADADIVFVPHSTRRQLGETQRPVMFYMQVMQRWLFTADPEGWGPATSRYPYSDYVSGNPDSGVWDSYRQRLVVCNESKFDQPAAATRENMIATGLIPAQPFIFFPCQIPHDESLTLFSDISESDLVRALGAWSRASGTPVVFKEHPANRRAMALLRTAAGPDVFWSEASIHDLVREAAAVYTLNSGVGFEALFHTTPIATFARAEYDVVTEIADIARLDAIWASCRNWDRDKGMRARRQFVDWYCRRHAIDLDAEPTVLHQRLSLLVKEAESLCRARPHRSA